MTAVIDDSSDSAGTHVLIIGISAYDYLSGTKGEPSEQGLDSGLVQLTSAARSASRFATWMMNDYHRKDFPLRSLRVLLSPNTEDEVAPALKLALGADSVPTRDNVASAFRNFKKAASRNPGNIAIVYVAGHGVQLTNTGAVLLLSDFAHPDHENERYRGAVDMRAMHESMTYSNGAKSQFWFVDICRQRPPEAREFEELAGVLKHDKGIAGAVACSPLFLSASNGEQAFAKPGELTLFCEALMLALAEGHAASSEGERASPWLVSTSSLQMYLKKTVSRLAEEREESQWTECTGIFNDEIFHECKAAPVVDLTVQVREGMEVTNYSAKIWQLEKILYDNHCAWPLRAKIPAGLYTIEVTTLSTKHKDSDHLKLTPPSRLKELPL
ncbi:caspase family protein [Pseudomonas sp. CC120222-01a]|uniref:caspase family protein n=1 Tax=Pseudomonas sp. CC120222-01a TaxID=1378075 RepID=UPI000D8CE64C|nr:caspase family protein [Pseudomonas sp. CC120222-01a]PVZ41016.1 caspase domain-containing protein [Pseudomonas sp. CC120222-01a]